MEENRNLTVSLIKEDLRSARLVLGLSGLGLDAGKYHTEISTLVFNLLALDAADDQLMGRYFEWIDQVTEIEDIEQEGRLAAMAEEYIKDCWRSRNKATSKPALYPGSR